MMKTSNKILIGLFATIFLLGIPLMMLLKANLVPYNPEEHLKTLTSLMGDIKGIESNGDFKIRVVQYNGDSGIEIKSKASIVDYFEFNKKDEDVLYLGVKDYISGTENAHVVVNMKECNRFLLSQSTDLHVANPLENIGNVIFALEDNAAADISLEGDTIRLKIADNGSIRLAGKAKYIIVEARDNGHIDASALEVDGASVSAKDNAAVNLKVNNKISGTVKDNASLEYKGNPVSEVIRENK